MPSRACQKRDKMEERVKIGEQLSYSLSNGDSIFNTDTGGPRMACNSSDSLCGDCEVGLEEKLNEGTRGRAAETGIDERVVDGCAADGGVDGQTRMEGTEHENQDDPVKAGEKEHMQIFWAAQAIKTWMRQWFRKYPAKTWTIDNHDGQESYKALQMEIDERCWQETQ